MINITNEERKKNNSIIENFIKFYELNHFDDTDNFGQIAWFTNIDRALNIIRTYHDLSQYNFIDIGSGEGIIIGYCEINYPFKKLYGVEIDYQKFILARKNMLKLNIHENRVNFENQNAIKYLLPNENNILFLFNPFDDSILKKFLNNNIDIIKKYNNIIIYLNDIHRDVFEKFEFKTLRNEKYKISIFNL
jgi:16S rRNA G966 N2-methylase RsmD